MLRNQLDSSVISVREQHLLFSMFFFFIFLKFFFPVWLEKHFKFLMVWMEVFEIICLRLNSSAAYNRFFFTLLRALMSRNMTGMEVFEIIFLRLNSSAAYNRLFFTLLRALMSRNMTGKSKHYLLYITKAFVCQFISLLIEAIT